MEKRKEEKICLLISGGEFCELPDHTDRPDYVIACDKGWQYAEQLGIRPDLIIGDFDSSPLPDLSVPVEKLPVRKDDTDTMHAARRAFETGCDHVMILCAFGGRLDHAFANIQTGAWLAERGIPTRLVGADTEAYVFRNGSLCLPRREGWSLSVFSLSDETSGVSISGTKYACEKVTLHNHFPLGVSNTWEKDEAVVEAEEGILFVICSRLKKGESI